MASSDVGHEEELAQRIKDWQFLKANTRSLLTDKPTQNTTANVWLLDKQSEFRFDDRDFINKHFPDHLVIMMGPIIER